MENTQKNNLDVEYIEVNNNLRHYGNMRFAQLTIFIALSGAMVTFVFTKLNTLTPSRKESELILGLEFIGLFLSILFWIMEESATRKWIGFKKRARKIEIVLKYKQLTDSPLSGLLSATNATRFLYAGAILFWMAAINMSEKSLLLSKP